MTYPELEGKLPPLVEEAVKTLGTYEYQGVPSNPIILEWAEELAKAGYEDFRSYTSDDLPWCSLWMSIVAHRAGYELPKKSNWSQAWRKWGFAVEGDEPGELGDVAVFIRDDPQRVLPKGSLGHAGIIIRAEPRALHIIGGNQSDMVSIIRKSRENCVAVRCPPPRKLP